MTVEIDTHHEEIRFMAARASHGTDATELSAEDLYQEGIIGVIQAEKTYAQTDQCSFKTYAKHRIQGAIRDAQRVWRVKGLRQFGWRRVKGVKRTTTHAAIVGMRQAIHRELYPAASPTDETLQCEHGELIRVVLALLHHLPTNEREVITQYYFYERTMAEIGRTMDRTEGRISQLHSKALARLRTLLEQDISDACR